MTGDHDDEKHRTPLRAAPGTPLIEQAARDRLGRNLRLLYTSVLDQPLPDRFTQLLDELSAASPVQKEQEDREGSR